MEIKAELVKPYSDTQRADFIVKQNHENGYDIRETKEALQAWGFTADEIARKEKERIGNLQITKRVFMLGLQQLGITYTQLKDLIATNEQAQMEWELCVELQRKNPLIDVMAADFGVSPAMLDYIFQKANGEDVQPPVQEEEQEN